MTNSGQSQVRRSGIAPADGGFATGAALFTFDAEKRIRSWNRAAEDGHGPRRRRRRRSPLLGGALCPRRGGRHGVPRRLLVPPPPLRALAGQPTRAPRPDGRPAVRRFRVPMIASDDPALFVALLVDPGEVPQPKPVFQRERACSLARAHRAATDGAGDARGRQAGPEDRGRAPSLGDDRAQPHPCHPAGAQLQVTAQRGRRGAPPRPRLRARRSARRPARAPPPVGTGCCSPRGRACACRPRASAACRASPGRSCTRRMAARSRP